MNRLLFAKEGKAKYISHLDLLRTMQRAFARAGAGVKHTEGFNPHPHMVFAMPLPVGMESVCELMDFELAGGGADGLAERLNEKLPSGLRAISVYEAERKFRDIAWLQVSGKLWYDGGNAAAAAETLSRLFSRPSLVVEKKTKRGSAEVDIIKGTDKITFVPGEGVTELRAVLSASEPAVSPALLLEAISAAAPEASPDFASFRRLELYGSDKKIFR